MNARQKRLFDEARKRNPDLKMPATTQPEWSEADLALIKQGVGDKTSRPAAGAAPEAGSSPAMDSGAQSGAIVTYFEATGFGFLRPEDGGRDVFFHISRLQDGDATELKPGTKVLYELGMDRTGKVAASSVRIAPPQ